MQKATSSSFKGFKQPEQNYSKLPHEFIDLLPEITALTEIKVLVYLLRHTWGYSEYDTLKRITIDEFVSGRKRKDGTRIDAGTGLSEQGVRDGIKKALEHEYITVEVDDSDKARVKKFYGLNILGLGVQDLESGVQDLDPDPPNSIPRTEKETIERNSKKEEPPKKTQSGWTPEQISLVNAFKTLTNSATFVPLENETKRWQDENRKAADQLIAAGVSVEMLGKFYKAEYTNGYTPSSLVEILRKIGAWLAKHTPPPASANGTSNYSDEVRAAVEARYKEKGLLK